MIIAGRGPYLKQLRAWYNGKMLYMRYGHENAAYEAHLV